MRTEKHFTLRSMLNEIKSRGFPVGPVVKCLPANAGDTGLIPIWGKIPMCRRATEPRLLKPAYHG